jgi:hypothetical protein
MSEQTFSPGAVAADAPADAGEQTGGRSYKTWIVAAAVGLVVAVAAYFLFFSGGSQDPAADGSGLVTKPAVSTAPSTAPSASASAPARTLPATQVGTSGRDPFKPVVTAPSPAASSAAPSASPSTSATTASGLPTSGVPNVLSVTKVDSAAGVVATTVNGKAYSAVLGGTFAKYFKLIAVGPTASCAVFQYGDATVPLCKGQSLTLTG